MIVSAELRQKTCNTLRMLAADAVQKANSGHPGAPMGQADLAFALWHHTLRFDPRDPSWPGRDRFVLSCGHASMLLYSLLHVWGYDVSMNDIKAFRQWDSLTPGHPEVGHTPGVEVTTGPLGQGVANSVGMAMAAKMLHARIDVADDKFQVMTQRIFAVCSDGDLMEGISHEAASLAGHWRLDNLVWLYDDNRITIDGTTDLAFTEDVEQRFESCGWRILRTDGHDHDGLVAALDEATQAAGKPTLIICRTHIGFGSPNRVDTSGVHGSPLGDDELAATKTNLGWPTEPRFLVPDDVKTVFAASIAQKKAERTAWDQNFKAWRARHPEQAALYDQLWSGALPDDLWKTLLDATPAEGATRKLSAKTVEALLDVAPIVSGGSADLAGSNGLKTGRKGLGHPESGGDVEFGYDGRHIYFGIREHAMAAITNGMLLHGGVRPYSGTFLVFSDYLRPSARLAALSHLPNIFVLTHDSVFLGQDGPTHQPIEHHWALRIIPGFTYFRPADGVEVAMGWAWAMQHAKGPVGFGLTRQSIPQIERHAGFVPQDVWRGGYATNDVPAPDVILVGTGSELHLCTGAAEVLSSEGVKVRVVSMPAYDLFVEQDAAYQQALFPAGVPIVTVEAGITAPWRAISGLNGLNIGIDRFGASAPAQIIAEKFGLTVPHVTDRVRGLLKG